jgi:hypothetical protein
MLRRRRGRASLLALAALGAVVFAGCGRDDFENDPRPPVPIEITVKVSDKDVAVSPGTFGAGLVNFTIVNLSTDPATLAVDGPTSAATDEIPPGGNTLLKTEMDPGSYEVSAEGPPDTLPYQLEVGPERPSGQNDLLLP